MPEKLLAVNAVVEEIALPRVALTLCVDGEMAGVDAALTTRVRVDVAL